MRNPSNARAWDKCAPSIHLAVILVLVIAAPLCAQDGKVVQVEPKSAVKFFDRGSAGLNKQDYDKAITDYTEAIRLDPNYFLAYLNRGNAWGAKKEYDKAIADYAEAIHLDPNDPRPYSNRGVVWHQKKDYDKAIIDFTEAIRVDPKYATAFNNRANVWEAKQEYAKAIADHSEVIRLDPKDAYAYSQRGFLRCKAKEYDNAIADYTESIRLDPNESAAYLDLARLRATCPDAKYRDGKGAVKSATKACDLGAWKVAYSIGILAAAHAAAGDFAKAIEFQTKANAMYDDADDKKKGEERLKLYQDKTPYREVKPWWTVK